ncbi:hypothetical protein WA845_03010 [Agrobacterium sp. CMT1]|uniref:hypothetical protein n=1 Tax=Agrobacterium sp. CMT1 TaxID=3128901 RepID=UPI003076E238
MKYNTKTTASASAVERIRSLISKADDLQFDLHKLNCLATVTDSAVSDILFTPRKMNDRPGYYYAGDADRKVLGFASNEVLALSSGVETSLEDLLDDLREVADLLHSLAANSDQ